VTTQTFQVSGMTCEHCVKAVSQEIGALVGVDQVSVSLVPGETSTVTVVSAAPLELAAVREAVDEAGYELVE
jgi:copper chaperone